MKTENRGSVLISGASIAGPALAYWLNKFGYNVTVVERAPGPRKGGYAVDLRGPAMEVVLRMGIVPRLKQSHINCEKVTFLNEDGSAAGVIRPQAASGGVAGRDVEVPRTALMEAVLDAIGDEVEFIYNESVSGISQDGDEVHVVFKSGIGRDFDLVIGADGVNSNTRKMTIDPGAECLKYLGYCFVGFSIPNYLDVWDENVSWNIPGKCAVLFSTTDRSEANAFMEFLTDEPPYERMKNDKDICALFREKFAGHGWEIPNLLKHMETADDLFYDATTYVDLEKWSDGRVALVGDAAYGPSFFTGQGASLAMVGAYVLAVELLTAADHVEAFANYERTMRPFVETNRALIEPGIATLHPRTQEEIDRRNAEISKPVMSVGEVGQEAHLSIDLPDHRYFI
ncbi:MAG: FAD-dependent monooxygenase [Spirochaetia bacterium]|jgi:2-polyprenyl-6-methoxyphenol hydroxylase-like FAD-dependent oxidoreductase|nr:FAD-dependent monooxygenase [Spirochaetia bacterium]